MKKIFLDTNFVIDYLLREEYKAEAQQFLACAARKGCKFYVSFLSVANFAYIARKIDKENLYRYISTIRKIFNVVKNDDKQLQTALNIETSDFEDALQYASALDANCDCIITRNAKDFRFSQIPILSSKEYLESDSKE